MNVSVKGDEKPIPDIEKEIKGRLCLRGDIQRDAFGRVVDVDEPGLHSDPITLSEGRMIVGMSELEEDPVVFQGDEESAYLITPLGGDEVVIELTEDLCTPEQWAFVQSKGFKRLVV